MTRPPPVESPQRSEEAFKTAIKEYLTDYVPGALAAVQDAPLASGQPVEARRIDLSCQSVNAVIADTDCPLTVDLGDAQGVKLKMDPQTGRYNVKADKVNVAITIDVLRLMRLLATMAAEAAMGPGEEVGDPAQMRREQELAMARAKQERQAALEAGRNQRAATLQAARTGQLTTSPYGNGAARDERDRQWAAFAAQSGAGQNPAEFAAKMEQMRAAQQKATPRAVGADAPPRTPPMNMGVTEQHAAQYPEHAAQFPEGPVLRKQAKRPAGAFLCGFNSPTEWFHGA